MINHDCNALYVRPSINTLLSLHENASKFPFAEVARTKG